MTTLLHFYHDIEIVERAALDAFRGGWATGEHWDTLAEARNMLWFGASRRSKAKHKSDQDAVREVARHAMAALRSIREREQRTGKFGCSADELNVIHALVETSRDFWVRQSSTLFLWALREVEACTKSDTN